jgi:hypothetical protein
MGIPNLNLDEIEPGLVMFLSHSDLEERGYRVSGQRSDRKGHHFLCLASDDRDSTWVMLTSQPGYGYGRVFIAASEKEGHPGWVETSTYVCGHDAVLKIDTWDLQASTTEDRSRPSRRNWVSQNMTEQLCRWLLRPHGMSAVSPM